MTKRLLALSIAFIAATGCATSPQRRTQSAACAPIVEIAKACFSAGTARTFDCNTEGDAMQEKAVERGIAQGAAQVLGDLCTASCSAPRENISWERVEASISTRICSGNG